MVRCPLHPVLANKHVTPPPPLNRGKMPISGTFGWYADYALP